MIKRCIRLKEFIPFRKKTHYPSSSYLGMGHQLSFREGYYESVSKFGGLEYPGLTDALGLSKMIFLGDSFIENIFVKESGRALNILQEIFLDNHIGIKIYNHGVSGSTGLGLLNSYLNKVIPMQPEYLVYIQPSCDFSALLYENGYYNNSKFFSNLTPSENTDKFFFETISKHADQIRHNIILLAESCRLNNIKLIVATCCSRSSKRQLQIMNDVVRELSEKYNYDLLDLDILVDRSEKYFYDKQHLNLRGSRVLSDTLSQFFLKKIQKNHSKQQLMFYKKTILADRNYQFPFEVSFAISDIHLFLGGGLFIEVDHQEDFNKDDKYIFEIVIELYSFSQILEKKIVTFQDLIGSKVEKSIVLDAINNSITDIIIKFPKNIGYQDFIIRYLKFYCFYR